MPVRWCTRHMLRVYRMRLIRQRERDTMSRRNRHSANTQNTTVAHTGLPLPSLSDRWIVCYHGMTASNPTQNTMCIYAIAGRHPHAHRITMYMELSRECDGLELRNTFGEGLWIPATAAPHWYIAYIMNDPDHTVY